MGAATQGAWRRACLALLTAAVLTLTGVEAFAQRSATGATNESWAALSATQKAALAPLREQWPSIDGVRREKWLEVAARFPSMPVDERNRVQARMSEWAALTPIERGKARVQFQETQRWSNEARQSRWEEYQTLHPDARKVLADRWKLDEAARRTQVIPASPAKRNVAEAPPAQVRPLQSATPATVRAQSGATSTLVSPRPAVPPTQQLGIPKIAATPTFVDPATLLPRRGPQGAAVVAVPASAAR